jgi:hypothetical protein
LAADSAVALPADFMAAEAVASTAVADTGNPHQPQHYKACSSERAFVFLAAPRGKA